MKPLLLAAWLVPAILLGSFVQARVVITDAPAAAAAGGNTQFTSEPISPQRAPVEKPLPVGKLSVGAPKRVSAQIQHGLQLLHGLQGPQDIKQAGYNFMLAYSRGDAQAPAAVAYCTMLGCYGVPDRRSVALWIERARLREPGKAKLLDWASAEQFNPTQPSARTAALLREAVALQDPVASNEQGLQQLTAGQRTAALRSFELATQRGSVAALRNFNLLMQQPEARSGFQTLEQTNPTSRAPIATPGQPQYEQAKRYHLGQEVPVNDVQAIELYRQAANLGHLQAKRMMDLIFSRQNLQGGPDAVWMRLLAQRYLGPGSLEMQATAIWLQKDISLLADWLPLE